VIYIGVFAWFSYIGLRDNFVSAIIATSVINCWLGGFLSLFFRPSLHAVGTGTLLAFLFYFQLFGENFFLLNESILAVLLGGIVWSSRLALQAHDYPELIVGTLIGFVSTSFIFYFMPII
jgi:hypothetical protein